MCVCVCQCSSVYILLKFKQYQDFSKKLSRAECLKVSQLIASSMHLLRTHSRFMLHFPLLLSHPVCHRPRFLFSAVLLPFSEATLCKLHCNYSCCEDCLNRKLYALYCCFTGCQLSISPWETSFYMQIAFSV